MKILITGHKGFIGSNLYDYLKEDYEIVGWEWTKGFPSLKGIDAVIHLGAISSTTYSDVDQIVLQNYDFSRSLLKEAITQKVKIFQYASSASVYGNTNHFTENKSLNPQSPYAWTKYLFDKHVRETDCSKDITVQGFRYFNVYGKKGEEHKKDMASPYTKFIDQAINKKEITLFEDSENFKRDFVCVEDVCEVHKQMLSKPENGIFNVGTGNPTSFEAIGRKIAKKYNAQINYIPMPENLKKQYQKFTKANVTKLENHVNISWKNILDYIDNV